MESVLPSQSPVPLDPANLFGLLNLNNFKADIGCALTLLMVWLVFIIAREIFSPLRKIPGPPGLPFVGQMFTFLRSKDHIELLSQWAHEYGPVFTYRSRFLAPPRVVICNPELLKQVTVTDSQKFERSDVAKILFPSIGNGLFTSNGRDHALQRKMIGPAFYYNSLKDMVTVFEDNVQNIVKIWTAAVDNSTKEFGEVNAQVDMNHLALDTIGKCAFGFDFDTVLSGESNVSKTFSELLQGADFRHLIRKALIPFYGYLPLAANQKINKAVELTNKTVLKVISERRQQKQKGICPGKRDLLEMLMDMYDEETGYKMDDEELRSQVLTFMLAGHETTSVSMSWTLHELSRHPEIQEKIREETDLEIKDGENLTWGKLEKLKYLGSVIKESLRLHPPAVTVLRNCKQDVCLGGYDVPSGTHVCLGICMMHRLPQYWTNPLEFNPDRFFDNSEEKIPIKPFTFVPFSSGPRHCIGDKFAVAEMKVVIATLLQHFSLAPVPGYEPKPRILITAKPSPLLKLRITKNERS